MATYSSVLTWRIPGTGEPVGLPPMGSHRVGHDWSDLAAPAASWLHKYVTKYGSSSGPNVSGQWEVLLHVIQGPSLLPSQGPAICQGLVFLHQVGETGKLWHRLLGDFKMKKVKRNVRPMNRNMKIHSERGSSFRIVHWFSSVWIPRCKGNIEKPELNQRRTDLESSKDRPRKYV